jgi:monovalent cation:H+ antiporter-2, CPA2 family
VLLYLVAAVLGVVACRSLKLPPMLGYLVVGVLIGPNALALAKDTAAVKYLAEFGVVFLMFVIGLEFNLPKLRSMRSLVFGLGLWQVTLTIAVTLMGHALLVWGYATLFGKAWQMSWQGAVVLGGALAMSSTAIVVKLMAERLELESEHGKRVIGVLLFQDLAVVPLLVLIPALSSPAEDMLIAMGWATLKAALLLTVLLVGGQRVMRWWLTLVARRKSEELFMLNLLLVTLGLAWMTEHAGLSLALGAFVAGMLVAETEYKHQVETDIRPFHDVLLGLFFITIGMKLDWRPVLEQWLLVLLLTTGPVLAKFVLVAALARVFKAAPGVALRTGLYLAQAGEFGFVLLTLGADNGLVAPDWMSPVLASMVLSMLATPFLIMYSNRIVNKLSSSDWMMQSVALTTIAKKAIATERHIIICGYGRSGQNLARLLVPEQIPYMALDLDPDRRRRSECGVRRRGAAAKPDGRRLGARQRGGGDLPRHRLGAEDPAPRAGPRAPGTGGGAHGGRRRHRQTARRRRRRSGARSHRRQPDAGRACAGAGGRADETCDPHHPRRTRRTLQFAARLFPRRR